MDDVRYREVSLYAQNCGPPVQLGKSDGSKVSNLETSAWQRRSIARSNSGVECKSR